MKISERIRFASFSDLGGGKLKDEMVERGQNLYVGGADLPTLCLNLDT